MRVGNPIWYLTQACPVCEQGTPVLVACPVCSTVAAICGEEGTAFPHPRELSIATEQTAMCLGCSAVPFSEFVSATSDQIIAAGLQRHEYD